jgi:heterodisulfide reductase subunit A
LPLDNVRIGVFVCDCGSNIAGMVDTESLREYAESLPGVVVSIGNKYSCADPGQQEIQKAIAEHNLNRLIPGSRRSKKPSPNTTSIGSSWLLAPPPPMSPSSVVALRGLG